MNKQGFNAGANYQQNEKKEKLCEKIYRTTSD